MTVGVNVEHPAVLDTALADLSAASTFSTRSPARSVGGRRRQEPRERAALARAEARRHGLRRAMKPLDNILGNAPAACRPLGGALGWRTAASSPAAGVTPFADGGVVRSPTFFPAGGGLGVWARRAARRCCRSPADATAASASLSGGAARRRRSSSTSTRPTPRASASPRRRSPRCSPAPSAAAAEDFDMPALVAFHEVRFPTDDRLRLGRRPGAADRGGDARLRQRGAQQPLGGFAPALQCRLRHPLDRRSPCGDRLLRGAARAALRLPLARPNGLQLGARQGPP